MTAKRDNIFLRNKVRQLCSLKQEGPYWDFKREWHSTKSDLLHDIICMANNLTKQDGMIIIGINEENNYSSVDVSNDPKRKNTQKIVDFLKDIHFAGDVRPTVIVDTILLDFNQVDVIIVKNDVFTPYYLAQEYKPKDDRPVPPYHIYTRIGDTNTAINRSADINNVEKLWKKRLGIDETPLERVKTYLHFPMDWEMSGNDETVLYYKQFPEFTYEEEYLPEKNDVKFFFYGQTDHYPRWHKARIKYHQTVLSEMLLIGLDGSRLITAAPSIQGFSMEQSSSHWDISFDYYIEDTLEYILSSYFLYDVYESNFEKTYIRNEFLKTILVFRDERDIEDFIDYAVGRWNSVNAAEYENQVPSFPPVEGMRMDVLSEQYRNGLILKDLLAEYYRHSDSAEREG